MGRNDRLDRPAFEIRPYLPEDIEGVIGSWMAASRLAHPFLSEEFLEGESKAIADVYMPQAVTDVAVIDGEIAGFISMLGDEVGAIFLYPAHHGKGVGKALMDKVAAGRSFLELDVFEKNKVGRAFYDRYGFKEIARSVHDATGETLIRMRWERA